MAKIKHRITPAWWSSWLLAVTSMLLIDWVGGSHLKLELSSTLLCAHTHKRWRNHYSFIWYECLDITANGWLGFSVKLEHRPTLYKCPINRHIRTLLGRYSHFLRSESCCQTWVWARQDNHLKMEIWGQAPLQSTFKCERHAWLMSHSRHLSYNMNTASKY